MSELRDILDRGRRGRGAAAELVGVPSAAQWSLPADASDAPQVEISDVRSQDWHSRAVLIDPSGAVAEQFRQLAVRVRRELDRGELSTLAVTSAMRSEGKSTVVCNFALALASISGNDRVALLELDLRRPRVAAGLGVEPQVGIEAVLDYRAPLERARLRTQVASLDLFLAKKSEVRAHELLSETDAVRLFQALTEVYRYVIVDTPPVLLVPDSPLLVPDLDACLFVVRRGRTRLATLTSALDLLPEEKLLGVFVNEIAAPVRSREYGYYTPS